MITVTISLDDQLALELAEVANREGVAEDELIREGIERLLHSRLGPGVPKFARRLGPLVTPSSGTPPDELARKPPTT